VVRDELGSQHFTRAVEDAWRAAFDVLARTMLDGLTSLPTAADRFFDRLPDDGTPEGAAATPAALDQFFG
jgi:hypothetical protein